jgi:site-specific recombinase XerD
MWVSKDSDNYKFMLSRDILFYDMMYFAGMNITELVDITIDDIDIENNTVCTKNKQYKIQKNVLEKLNAYILNWDIKSYIFKRGTNSDTHITRQSVNKKLKNFSEKTDLDISPINLKRLNYSKN